MKHIHELTTDQKEALSLYDNLDLQDAGDLQNERVRIGSLGVAKALQSVTGFVAGKRPSSINSPRWGETGWLYVIITDQPWKSGSHMSSGCSIQLERSLFERESEVKA